MAQQFTPVGWLIDDDTEHARMLLGSDWQRDKMGMSNMLVVTLLDAQNSVALAVAAERERLVAKAATLGWAMRCDDPFEDAVRDLCNMRA